MGLTISIRDPKTKESKTYTQDFAPIKKQIELFKMTPENYPDYTEEDWVEKNAEFVAGLFDNPEVTKDAILNGVSSKQFTELLTNATNFVLGIDPKKSTPAIKESAGKKRSSK